MSEIVLFTGYLLFLCLLCIYFKDRAALEYCRRLLHYYQKESVEYAELKEEIEHLAQLSTGQCQCHNFRHLSDEVNGDTNE